jgi:peptidoglycan/LPS O-acetylase OafA/YrhL
MPPSKHVPLDSLTGLRFVAALGVVFEHLVYNFGGIPLLAPVAGLGYLGVVFFFVLSGFVLTWSRRPSDGPKAFYQRRFARIYPLYLAAMIPGVLLAVLGGDPMSWPGAALNVLGVQSWWPARWTIGLSPNPVGWTIACEVFFYAAFPFLVRPISRLGVRGLLVLLASSYATMAVALGVGLFVLDDTVVERIFYALPAYNLGFFLVGIVLARLVELGAWPSVPLAVPVGAVALSVGLLVVVPSSHGVGPVVVIAPVVELLALPSLVAVIASAAQSDIDGRPSVFRSAVFVELGVWSYALYITHWQLGRVVSAAFPGGLASLGPILNVAGSAAFVATAIGLAYLAHRFIERPWERRLRGTSVPRVNNDAAPAAHG